MMIPILAATAGLEGAFTFAPVERDDGAAVISVRFRGPRLADLCCQYSTVFIFELVDGLIERGDFAAGHDAARAAVRALELKHARRRLAAARAALERETVYDPVAGP